MCGICGFFSSESRELGTKNELEKMTAALAHRGPDATGFFSDDIVSLGHTRLSILDLSAAANQPMYSRDNRYVIIYNGEVYNFKEIAAELKINFKTTSDTEVILEAFAKWGIDFIHKLNGMFACAIYDKQEKNLFLFRDRMGIKPLFYYWDGKNFAFASELKSLLQSGFVKQKTKINNIAINYFLHLGYIPEPHTIYENIFKFPAGNFLVVNENQFSFKSYWKLEEQITKETITDLHSAKNQFKELITSSVKYRLISDVPYGTFLSGGTDSSLITAVAQKLTGNLKTFSIGFKESKYNEAPYAKAIADYLKTEHYEFIVSYKDAINLMDDLITTYDEPFADSSAIPTMLVSKLARQYVKMTLSGDGGDELFFGYGAYHWAKRLANPLVQTFRKPIAYALSKMKSREKRAALMFQYPDKEKIRSHIFSQEQYFFSEEEIQSIVTPDFYFSALSFGEEVPLIKGGLRGMSGVRSRKLNAKEEQALFDLNYYLKDDLLVKVDRASMKYGLETRVPLLDYRIVEFALNLSPSLKSKNGIDKFLLKETLYDFVPEKYFQRKKWGFALPMQGWLKNELRYLIDENLSKQVIESFNFVNYSSVAELKKRFFAGDDYLYNRIWTLIVLHKFLKQFV